MLNDHDSSMAAESIRMVAYDIERAMSRPSVLFRPKLCKWEYDDGRGVYWTANYHEVEAKGYSPEDAMLAFDKEWLKSTKTEGQNP